MLMSLELCIRAICLCGRVQTSLVRRQLASQPVVQTLVGRMAVRCGQAPACPWTGTFDQRGQNLIKRDAHCPLKELRCDRSGESLLRRAAAVHAARAQRQSGGMTSVCQADAAGHRCGSSAGAATAIHPT